MIRFRRLVVFMPLATLIIVLAFNLMNIWLSEYDSDELIYKISRFLSDVFGFSFVSVGVYTYMAWRHRFCLYSKIAIIGLLFQNILNIVDFSFSLDYNIYIECVSIFGASIFILFSLIFSKK